MGMASGNESKINTTLFLNTADQLGAVSKSLQGQFQEWQQAMNSLRGQWQGEGSDQVRNAAMQIKKSSEELLKNLSAYQVTLQEMAGVYDKTEKNITEKGKTLKVERTFR